MMKKLIFKYSCIFIILMYCLAPICAGDLAQDNNTKYINEDNNNDIAVKDVNITADNDENEVDDVKLDKKTEIDNAKALNANLDEKKNPSMAVISENINQGEIESIQLISPDGINADLTVLIGNQERSVSMKNGFASLDIEGLDSGRYTVNVIGYEVRGHTTFTVNRIKEPGLFVDVDNIVAGQKPVVRVSTYNAYKGDIVIKLGNETQTVQGGGNSKVTFDQDLLPGEYEVEVVCSPYERYNETQKTVKFTVSNNYTVDAFVSSVEVGEPVLVSTRTTKNFDGYVLCYIDDPEGFSAVKNVKDGYSNCAFEDVDLAPGVHKMYIKHYGSEVFGNSTTCVEFTIKPKAEDL